MQRKQRYRYYCDFCKKSGGSAFHMKRHEKSCTNNPDRVCRMCVAAGLKQVDRAVLAVALVKDCKDFDALECEPITEVPTLAEAANNCPACILSTLRLSTPAGVWVNWSFPEAVSEFWKNVNSEVYDLEQHRRDYYASIQTNY